MGSYCGKPVPDVQVEVEGNTCFDDMKCTSTCCMVKKGHTHKHNKKVKVDHQTTQTDHTTQPSPSPLYQNPESLMEPGSVFEHR